MLRESDLSRRGVRSLRLGRCCSSPRSRQVAISRRNSRRWKLRQGSQYDAQPSARAFALNFSLASAAAPLPMWRTVTDRTSRNRKQSLPDCQGAGGLRLFFAASGENMDRAADDVETVIVETPLGRLAGERSGDLFVFRGIPYARPPVGPRRWCLPEPVEPWPGVRDATQFGPICPQAPTQIEVLLGGSLGAQSEDCLYLNVWTTGCDGGKRPVMVWIHGGAFVIGAGSQSIYNGRHLAARGCVIVTINYRLGVFGFLNLADAVGEAGVGNGAEGIADQVLALHWVKQNIAAFGGDPENVTVFGESAGAMSIGLLLSIPAARGLFQKAIAQSGAAHIGYERERSARVARAFVEVLGNPPA